MWPEKRIFSILGLILWGMSGGWSAAQEDRTSKGLASAAEASKSAAPLKRESLEEVQVHKKLVSGSRSPLAKKKISRLPVRSTHRFKINPPRSPVGSPPEVQDDENGGIMRASLAFTDFDLPTDNQMMFSKMHSRNFFQPTFSGRIVSAMFGCVRNPGHRGAFTRFHEGIDIRPMERDESGEPQDEVRSAGKGRVIHVCRESRDSNYGEYIVIEHDLFGAPLYTLYAHLSSIEEDLRIGDLVEKGRKIGVLGRTSNEYDIELEHAHLHFEVDLMVNDRYTEWCRKKGAGEPNHGLYNGTNLIGLDPVNFFKFLQINPDLGLSEFVLREKVAFRVLAPARKDFSWIRRYPFALIQPVSENTHAFEIAMTYYGLPVSVTPRSRKEISPKALMALSHGIYPMTYANTTELTSHSCCRLVEKRGDRWKLGEKGSEWLQQLLY